MTQKAPTLYDDLNTILADFASSVQQILKDNFVGVYLQGSFATGGVDQNSDVDFIVITERELSSHEVATLQTMHRRIFEYNILWAKHLEGSYVPKAIFAQYDDCSAPLWYLDNGSRTFEQSTHCNTIIVRTVIRDLSITLAGQPAHEVVVPVPVTVLRQYIADDMREWGAEILDNPDRFANQFYQVFILENYCRMLHDFTRGIPGSKPEGTTRAKSHLDARWHNLIDRTLQTRKNNSLSGIDPADPQDFQETLEFVQYAIQKLEDYKHLLAE
ncbi:MAG: nucleotidyltransferase domain-containing protein [Aggregatilineales bacterium]